MVGWQGKCWWGWGCRKGGSLEEMRWKIGSHGAGGEAAGENMGRMEGGGNRPEEDEKQQPRGGCKAGMAPVPLLLRRHSRPARERLLFGQDAGHGISCWEGHIVLVELAGDIRAEGENEEQAGESPPRGAASSFSPFHTAGSSSPDFHLEQNTFAVVALGSGSSSAPKTSGIAGCDALSISLWSLDATWCGHRAGRPSPEDGDT